MSLHLKIRGSLLAALLAITSIVVCSAAAQYDAVHVVSGFIKHVDHDTKTVVIKTADGTEHTIRYTERTTVTGAKDAGKEVARGSTDAYLDARTGAKVTVKYVNKGADKTAVAVKDAVK